MNIVLTGATGTLGSRILFSLLESRLQDLGTIYLPVRKKKLLSPKMRIKNMLLSEYAPEFIRSNKHKISNKIVVLDSEELLYPDRFLGQETIDYFIHSAGFVNLSTHPSAKKGIFDENLKFTQDIFNAYSFHIRKFIYISTAFAIGDIGGMLNNDYGISKGKNYRNYYEASKHECEQFLMREGKTRNIPVQILRPSVLGGNISDAPHFFISKYMVFYLFAKFFNNSKSKEKVRISTNKGTGLNIIPTDYAAKVIVKVMDTGIEQLNIVHSQETDLRQGISRIFEAVGFTNYTFTHEKIDEKLGFGTKLEQFYYETIGIHLHPYLASKPNKWDTTLLESILPLPHYNLEDYLTDTVAFAKTKGFRNQKW